MFFDRTLGALASALAAFIALVIQRGFDFISLRPRCDHPTVLALNAQVFADQWGKVMTD